MALVLSFCFCLVCMEDHPSQSVSMKKLFLSLTDRSYDPSQLNSNLCNSSRNCPHKPLFLSMRDRSSDPSHSNLCNGSRNCHAQARPASIPFYPGTFPLYTFCVSAVRFLSCYGITTCFASDSLREAIGLKPNQLPSYIYRMRLFGYPPGWLMEANRKTSTLAMYDKDGNGKHPRLIKAAV